jgi:hypothetical protein
MHPINGSMVVKHCRKNVTIYNFKNNNAKNQEYFSKEQPFYDIQKLNPKTKMRYQDKEFSKGQY